MFKTFKSYKRLDSELIKFDFFGLSIDSFFVEPEEGLSLCASMQTFLICMPLSCDASGLAWAKREKLRCILVFADFFTFLLKVLKEFNKLCISLLKTC